MKFWMNIAAAATLSALATTAGAATEADARTLLAAAQAEIASKGLEAAAAQFNTDARWRTDKTYVVVVGFDGHMFAHSQNDKLVGKNMLEVRDAGGKQFIRATIENVKAGPESLIELRWTNPATKKIDTGHMLARRVAGKDAYVGVPFFD